MNKRLLLVLCLFCACVSWADVHITIANPKTWSTQELSDYVGQTVIFDSPLYICVNTSGTLVVAPWRHFQPNNQGVAGSAEYNQAIRANGCSISLSGVPSRSYDNPYRCGEKVYNLKAKVNDINNLTWISGEWRGNKRADLEAGIPDLGDYRLLVCGFNLENYFMTLNSMGARTNSERQAQRAKISKALKRINADIYGLVELEQGDEAIGEIVSDLNSNLPGRNYKYFHDASSGSSQKSDFVYDANKVEPIGTPCEISTELPNRKKMICFREIETGEKFIYSINHFKSMNTGDEYRRVNEARAVLDFYKSSYRQNPEIKDNDVLFMGDLNCYAKTEPIFVFTDRGMIDLHRAFHADSSYSYMYSRLASYIDHAICNETLYPQVTGMAAFHINSDEDDRYTYDKSDDETMFRCSDHDPVLVGLKLDGSIVYDPTPQLNSSDIISGESNRLIIKNAHKDGENSYYAIYTVSGLLLERKEILSVFYETELPQNAGVYVVYVYFDGQVYQRKMIVP